MDQSKEDRKWLHEKMQSKGYNVGSYEEFEKSLQNKDDADWYYRKANEIGLNIGTRDDFDSIFVGKPQDPLLQTPWQQKPAAEITPTDSVTTETEPVNITEPVNVAEPKNEKPVDPEKLKQYIIDHKGEVFNPKTVDM